MSAIKIEEEANRRNIDLALVDLTNTKDKIPRIRGQQPMIRNREVRFLKKHAKLLEQLRQFPMGAHDDGPDALEKAIRAGEDGSLCSLRDLRHPFTQAVAI